jgi:hypothetical protein
MKGNKTIREINTEYHLVSRRKYVFRQVETFKKNFPKPGQNSRKWIRFGAERKRRPKEFLAFESEIIND